MKRGRRHSKNQKLNGLFMDTDTDMEVWSLNLRLRMDRLIDWSIIVGKILIIYDHLELSIISKCKHVDMWDQEKSQQVHFAKWGKLWPALQTLLGHEKRVDSFGRDEKSGLAIAGLADCLYSLDNDKAHFSRPTCRLDHLS